MKTIWSTKDTLKVRMDLQEENIRPNLHPVPGRKKRSLILPTVPYVLTREEKKIFVGIIQVLKTPIHYVRHLGASGPLGGSRHRDAPPKHAQPGRVHVEHASLDEKKTKKYQVAQV
jgi:hypothetical protein